jgi:hypothetical protein
MTSSAVCLIRLADSVHDHGSDGVAAVRLLQQIIRQAASSYFGNVLVITATSSSSRSQKPMQYSNPQVSMQAEGTPPAWLHAFGIFERSISSHFDQDQVSSAKY